VVVGFFLVSFFVTFVLFQNGVSTISFLPTNVPVLLDDHLRESLFFTLFTNAASVRYSKADYQGELARSIVAPIVLHLVELQQTQTKIAIHHLLFRCIRTHLLVPIADNRLAFSELRRRFSIFNTLHVLQLLIEGSQIVDDWWNLPGGKANLVHWIENDLISSIHTSKVLPFPHLIKSDDDFSFQVDPNLLRDLHLAMEEWEQLLRQLQEMNHVLFPSFQLAHRYLSLSLYYAKWRNFLFHLTHSTDKKDLHTDIQGLCSFLESHSTRPSSPSSPRAEVFHQTCAAWHEAYISLIQEIPTQWDSLPALLRDMTRLYALRRFHQGKSHESLIHPLMTQALRSGCEMLLSKPSEWSEETWIEECTKPTSPVITMMNLCLIPPQRHLAQIVFLYQQITTDFPRKAIQTFLSSTSSLTADNSIRKTLESQLRRDHPCLMIVGDSQSLQQLVFRVIDSSSGLLGQYMMKVASKVVFRKSTTLSFSLQCKMKSFAKEVEMVSNILYSSSVAANYPADTVREVWRVFHSWPKKLDQGGFEALFSRCSNTFSFPSHEFPDLSSFNLALFASIYPFERDDENGCKMLHSLIDEVEISGPFQGWPDNKVRVMLVSTSGIHSSLLRETIYGLICLQREKTTFDVEHRSLLNALADRVTRYPSNKEVDTIVMGSDVEASEWPNFFSFRNKALVETGDVVVNRMFEDFIKRANCYCHASWLSAYEAIEKFKLRKRKADEEREEVVKR
jgi:hypothetical protein